MDHFYEQVVIKHRRGFNEFLFYLSMPVMIMLIAYAIVLLTVIPVSFNILSVLQIVISIGMAVAIWLFRPRLRCQFEYTFTNGEMDFAQVFNNSKRKALGSLKVQHVDAFGKVSGASFNRYLSQSGITQMRWFLNREAELYYFYFQKNNTKKLLILQPNDEMLKCILHYLPNHVRQDGI